MAEEIGVAVLGFGLAGRVFHAPFVNAVPGLRLAVIAQRRGEEAAVAWPGARVVRSVEEAIADPAVELVVVATPNETHFGMAMAALGAGKHAVVDKPIASSSEEVRQMRELAERKGVLLIPFHNRRWDGDFRTVQELVAGGEMGRLVTAESHFDRFRPMPRAGTWKEASGPGSGLLMDLGPHLMDQMLVLFGAPQWVEADVRRDRAGTAIEDAFDVTMGYEGMRAMCRSTTVAAIPSPRFLLHGTGGSFRKYGLDRQEPALVAGARVPRMGAEEVWLEEDEAAWGELVTAADPEQRPGDLQRRRVKTVQGDYRAFYAGVRDAVLGKGGPPVTAEDGWRVLRLIEMARQSSDEGRRVPVEF